MRTRTQSTADKGALTVPEIRERLKELEKKLPELKRKMLEEYPALLHRFITDKSTTYEEPIRIKPLKGVPIGFSLGKYTASLFALTRTSKKDIAKMIHTSHATVRTWNNQKDFQEEVKQHIREFCKLFVAHAHNRMNDPSRNFREFGDANFYSLDLLIELISEIRKDQEGAWKEGNILSLPLFMEYENIVHAMRLFDRHEKIGRGRLDLTRGFREFWKTVDQFEKTMPKIRTGILLLGLKGLHGMLLRPTLSQEDRDGALFILQQMEDFVSSDLREDLKTLQENKEAQHNAGILEESNGRL